ncbi:cell division control protein 6 homolog [Saccoglossus kowalevskii]|uniref:Cell division control protein n=1 Tax=Saccoglossus kowalevskii TaxID=10224 RepID=A0ABM0GMH8_SACKO|nr:PREDICTED: cell division control protein 6 homolog [Saccoglossus kowalevskii]
MSEQSTISFQRRKTRSQTKSEKSPARISKKKDNKVTEGLPIHRKRHQQKDKECKESQSCPSTPKCSPRKIKKENIPVSECQLKEFTVKLNNIGSRSPVKVPCNSPVKTINHHVAVKKLQSENLQNVQDVSVKSISCSSPVRDQINTKCVKSPPPCTKQLQTPSHLQSPSQQKQTPLKLMRQEGECYNKVKRALHASMPENLLCREKETVAITNFLRTHVGKSKPGSLYISGAPGTGKTASLMQIISNNKSEMENTKVIFVNCMSLQHSNAIYRKVISELTHSSQKCSSKDSAKYLEKKLTSPGKTVLLILDEIDQLDSRNQEVLYTMFEWPSLPKSRLVLIGIANALDLTDRILPRLEARPKCKPQLLNFSPYSKDQIVTILTDRLNKTKIDGAPVVDPAAIQFCARKVAAVAGDMRKALDICRRAVEVVESDVRSQFILQPSSQASVTQSQRKTSPKPGIPKKVGLLHISSVISDVYGSKMVSSNKQQQTFPVQQKLIICTLLLMVKQGKVKEITLGKLHESYCKVCQSRQVGSVDRSEFLSLCSLIESRGIIGLKKGKDSIMTKISLKLEEKEVEFALQDKVLMSSILQAGLPSKK